MQSSASALNLSEIGPKQKKFQRIGNETTVKFFQANHFVCIEVRAFC